MRYFLSTYAHAIWLCYAQDDEDAGMDFFVTEYPEWVWRVLYPLTNAIVKELWYQYYCDEQME